LGREDQVEFIASSRAKTIRKAIITAIAKIEPWVPEAVSGGVRVATMREACRFACKETTRFLQWCSAYHYRRHNGFVNEPKKFS
jgi:hypothetical protein